MEEITSSKAKTLGEIYEGLSYEEKARRMLCKPSGTVTLDRKDCIGGELEHLLRKRVERVWVRLQEDYDPRDSIFRGYRYEKYNVRKHGRRKAGHMAARYTLPVLSVEHATDKAVLFNLVPSVEVDGEEREIPKEKRQLWIPRKAIYKRPRGLVYGFYFGIDNKMFVYADRLTVEPRDRVMISRRLMYNKIGVDIGLCKASDK